MQKKKLIEVALPLEAINRASAREKSIRFGHPATLHLWWARRPLAAARAVIFAQMVDDPSGYPDLFPTERAQKKERARLFNIIENLVQWENSNNEKVLQEARDAIWECWRRSCAQNSSHPQADSLFDRNTLPGFHDPFCGGGALPLEAQRLGLQSYASDLNPVSILINKGMIEIPPRVFGKDPVNPTWTSKSLSERAITVWSGSQGLAEDVRYYGRWMRQQAERKLGNYYPRIEVTPEMAYERPEIQQYVGQSLKVIAWIWARTVKSPNPAFTDIEVPLTSSFVLSTRAGREVYLEPKIDGTTYKFSIKTGKPKNSSETKTGTKIGRGSNFKCLLSGAPITGDYIKSEGKAGRIGSRMLAIVAEGGRGRVYLPATDAHQKIANVSEPLWKPETLLPDSALGFSVQLYYQNGQYSDLFTARQLNLLTTYSELAREVKEKVISDIEGRKESNNPDSIFYANAVTHYLALAVDKVADYGSSLVMWSPTRDQLKTTFARNAMPMVWDFAEVNPFAEAAGDLAVSVEGIARVLDGFQQKTLGFVNQADAQTQTISSGKVISTDPPYYDNIGYADLSDFFYSWLRPTLKSVYPDLLTTLAVPKFEELVATPSRHGGRSSAQEFFMSGMKSAINQLATLAHPEFPLSIYYAFKQSEDDDEGVASTGWETFLDAIHQSNLLITGTWPIRTEREVRSRGINSNALATSIVLVCRKRAPDAPAATRREFLKALKEELPEALEFLQAGNIAPVDLAQAAIGPGMAVYTRYKDVLDAEGGSLTVRSALALINQVLAEVLAEQEGDFDADTRWALAWFEQFGFEENEFGVAEQLSKAKNTAVSGLVEAGIIAAGKGKVRLLKPDELPEDWDPTTDSRLTVWEMVHHLVRALEAGGESAAANIVAKLGSKSDTARELCYRLYTLCERKKRANEAMAYNALVQSWPEIVRLARETPRSSMPGTDDLFDKD